MARKLKVVDVTKKDSIDPISLIRELSVIKQQKSELEKREKQIKEKLDKYVDSNVTADANGHRFYKTTDDFGNPLVLKREARKSVSLDLDKLKKVFPKHILDEIIKEETVEIIQEDIIEQMIASEEISLDDLEQATNIKVTYATTFVKQVEEEGEE